MVANLAYDRWSDIYPLIAEEIVELENDGFELANELDEHFTKSYTDWNK